MCGGGGGRVGECVGACVRVRRRGEGYVSITLHVLVVVL